MNDFIFSYYSAACIWFFSQQNQVVENKHRERVSSPGETIHNRCQLKRWRTILESSVTMASKSFSGFHSAILICQHNTFWFEKNDQLGMWCTHKWVLLFTQKNGYFYGYTTHLYVHRNKWRAKRIGAGERNLGGEWLVELELKWKPTLSFICVHCCLREGLAAGNECGSNFFGILRRRV